MSKMDLLAQAVRDLAHGNHGDVHVSLDAYDTYEDDVIASIPEESVPE